MIRNDYDETYERAEIAAAHGARHTHIHPVDLMYLIEFWWQWNHLEDAA